jgi:Holliday junction resolvase
VWLKANEFLAWRNFVGGVKTNRGSAANPGMRGSPDILAVKDGLFYGIEVKTPEGKVSKHQAEWHEKARQFGAIILVVTSRQQLADDIAFSSTQFAEVFK